MDVGLVSTAAWLNLGQAGSSVERASASEKQIFPPLHAQPGGTERERIISTFLIIYLDTGFRLLKN